jgi:hypothetical protein
MVYKVMLRNRVVMLSIHKLRKFNLTMSVKLIVLESDIEVLLGTGFWPEGIKCRVWVQN